MNPRTRTILIVGGAALLIATCIFVVPPLLPPIFQGTNNATPTFTPEKPTRTPTPIVPTKTPGVQLTDTPTPTSPAFIAPPSLPSPFDIILYFTNGTCGGGNASYSYRFTIDGTSLTVLQTDAGITTTGTYDPATGAFSTSGDVGPGTETYDGAIGFDGTTITIKGSYTWTPDGGATCGAVVAGTATP